MKAKLRFTVVHPESPVHGHVFEAVGHAKTAVESDEQAWDCRDVETGETRVFYPSHVGETLKLLK
jgi:hypothetical protein